MSIQNEDITVVMQGGLGLGYDIRYPVQHMRSVFPGARFILSTQKEETKTLEHPEIFDAVVLTEDPGALPALKFDGSALNINRQIASTSAGLKAVKTPYAIKLRTDSNLTSRKVVDLWSTWQDAPRRRDDGRSRILTTTFFTLNPRLSQRLPYHVSDWFQFGRTSDLQDFWACPDYDFEASTWYENHSHAAGSQPDERAFRSRWAVEQWLVLHYLFGSGPWPIDYHNDVSGEIVDRFEDDLVDSFIVAHPLDIGLVCPKYKWTLKHIHVNALCYSYEDWKKLIRAKRGAALDEQVGFTRWPRTEREIALYWFMRNPRVSWLRKLPGWPGRKLRRYFYT